MLKNLIITIIVAVAIFMVPAIVHAEEQICVTQYGGGVVCGAKTPEYHAPVNAGIADFNFSIIGAGFMSIAGLLYWKSRSVAH